MTGALPAPRSTSVASFHPQGASKAISSIRTPATDADVPLLSAIWPRLWSLSVDQPAPSAGSGANPTQLGLWSFAVAIAHGAGLMLVPIYSGGDGSNAREMHRFRSIRGLRNRRGQRSFLKKNTKRKFHRFALTRQIGGLSPYPSKRMPHVSASRDDNAPLTSKTELDLWPAPHCGTRH